MNYGCTQLREGMHREWGKKTWIVTMKLTSIRDALGDKGFPSSHTTKSETSSTTPAFRG